MSDSSFENYMGDITTRSAALSMGGNPTPHYTGHRASTSTPWASVEDHATNFAQVNSAVNAHAYTLITALENFMLPIIFEHTSSFDNRSQNTYSGAPDIGRPQLRPEAQNLLSALEGFVSTYLRLPLDRHVEAEGAQASTVRPEEAVRLIPQSTQHVVERNLTPPIIPSNVTSDPPLLKLALEEARHRVFNKMPIRLLAFYPNGSGMELIERSTIWDTVSARMIANFNEGIIQNGIRNLTNGHHSQSEAEQQLIEEFVSENTRYAILSHTWLQETPGEVTYANWMSGEIDRGSAGYRKLANFCRVAATNYQVSLGWMDTICINKESSAELDESIRSMCKWYRDAYVCITYLARTTFLVDMHTDPWFTRGWTLQELLAPRCIKFYNSLWIQVNLEGPPMESDINLWNHRILQEIRSATSIAPYEFKLFQASPQDIRISRRMQWAANRRVTREEDMAYSLMGIFDVSIPIAYGEGSQRAFFRLVKEILTSSNEDLLDIVNWAAGPGLPVSLHHNTSASSLIPSGPKQYLWRAERSINWLPLTKPITLTHLGLHLPVLLMRAVSADSMTAPYADYYPGSTFAPCGNYYATVSIDALNPNSIRYTLPQVYNVLETPDEPTAPTKDGWNRNKTRFQLVFGVLNFQETETSIELSENLSCLAVCLYFSQKNVKRIATSQAIVFDLKEAHSPAPSRQNTEIPKDELERHGMRLLTMYL